MIKFQFSELFKIPNMLCRGGALPLPKGHNFYLVLYMAHKAKSLYPIHLETFAHEGGAVPLPYNGVVR